MENVKTDKQGNYIGDGTYHAEYNVFEFDNKEVSHSISKSSSTESVYVTYSYGDKSVTVRFSCHENNAIKFGDQLNGSWATKKEVMYHLGLMKRTFLQDYFFSIKTQQIKKKEVANYEISELTIKEMYDMGEGANLSTHKGKVAKDSNYLILGDTVEKIGKVTTDAFGNAVKLGHFIYE